MNTKKEWPRHILIAGTAVLCLSSVSHAIAAVRPPALASLSGRVTADKPAGQLSIYALNTDKHIGYMVYVVGGQYRATHLFPGHYDVTLRGTAGQRNWSLPQQTRQLRIAAGATANLDFTLAVPTLAPSYVGGMPYPNAKVEPYDSIYPTGAGRDVIERVCFGCHTSSFFPYNVVRTYPGGRTQHDRDGWALTVDRMAKGVAFNTAGKASYFDPLLLSPVERDALIDYLAKNFGPDSLPRAVEQDADPPLDAATLEKAEFIEYRFANTLGENDRFTHTPDFDRNGNVWIMDRGGESLVKIDPVTGTITDHKGHGGGEFLTVDIDGSVWYGGLSHFDPAKNLHDEYKFEWKKAARNIPISTLIIDRHGDIWLSLLTTGGIAKFDRQQNSVIWWDVPILRSRPYGITLDRNDKVWFAEYHNSGIASFDPKTNAFRHYRLTTGTPTNIRRLAVDSKNFIWSATWGSRALQNGALYHLNPATAEVEEFKIGIPFANPYDVELDANDKVWVATDNHLLKFDPVSRAFTLYPVPERTDIPKIAVTRDGAVWFGPRNAGQSGGYGGAAGVLYPDKDKIGSGAAFYSPENPRYRKASYQGAATPVTGKTILVPASPQNPCEFAQSVGLGATCSDAAPATPGAPAMIKGGAAKE